MNYGQLTEAQAQADQFGRDVWRQGKLMEVERLFNENKISIAKEDCKHYGIICDPDNLRFATRMDYIFNYAILFAAIALLVYGVGLLWVPDRFWAVKISTLSESERKAQLGKLRIRAGWTLAVGVVLLYVAYVAIEPMPGWWK